MFLRSWRFLTLLLAALSLTMESAHVLELPQKMKYDPQMYTEVNGTLYRYFAVVGGSYQVGAIAAAAVLVFLVRRRPQAYRWTLVGALFLVLAFCIWLAVVSPVNRQVASAMQVAPHTVPLIWTEMRDRWEYGHAAGFAVQLIGFGALLASLLVETPKDWPHARPLAERPPTSVPPDRP